MNKPTCLTYDFGNFLSVARRLGKDCESYYYSPWKDGGATKSHKLMIGFGLPGIHRVRNVWDAIDHANFDFICFADVLDGDLQSSLRRRGVPVWGCGKGEELELYRPEAKRLFKKLGLPVGEYEVVNGIESLAKFCKEHDGEVWFIKGSLTRADWETYKHENWFETEAVLSEWGHTHQGIKDIFEWTAEKDIPADIEVGYDDITIDGKFPKTNVMYGVESKDLAYFGSVKPYDDLPEPVRFVNAKMAPILEQYQYRGAFSTEIRVGKDDGKPYLIDITARFPSPPSEIYTENWTNFSQRIQAGANGELMEAETDKPFAAQIILKSTWAEKAWMPLKIEPEAERWIKFKNLCRVNGVLKVVPAFAGLQEVGSAIGLGNTPKEACDLAKKHAKMVHGLELKYDEHALDEAAAQMISKKPVANPSESKEG